jgi:hypothetical protein
LGFENIKTCIDVSIFDGRAISWWTMNKPERRVRLLILSIVATVAACGGNVIKNNPDGNGDGGPNDGSAIDAAPTVGPVDITVYGPNSMPEAGSRVLFVAPDGVTTQSAFTDANGKVTHIVTSGSTVHVVPIAGDALLTTLGVNPGDQLVYGHPGLRVGAGGGSMTVELKNTPSGSGGFRALSSACASGAVDSGTATTMTLGVSCDRFDLLIGAYGTDGTGKNIAVAFSANHAFVNGGSIDSSSMWIPVVDQLSLLNQPANVSKIFGYARRLILDGQLESIFGENGGATTAALSLPKLPTRSSYEATLSHVNQSLKPITATQVQPAGAAAVLDFSVTSLPWITAPVFDAVTRKVQWTVDGAGTPTFKNIVMTYKIGSATRTWTIVAPGDATTALTLPALPIELAAQDVTTATNIVPVVQLFRFNAPLTYNDVRSEALQRVPYYSPWTQNPRVTAFTISGGR